MGLFSIFGQPKNKENCFLIIDIGGFSVKCLIVKADIANEEIHVIGYGKSELTPGDVHEGQIINILPVAEKTDDAIEQAVLQSGIRPSMAIAGIIGPNLISQNTKIIYQRKKPDLKITPKELSQILNDSQQQLKQEIINSKTDHEIELINASVVESYIDQVFVKNPLEFQGKSISMLLYSSFAPIIQLNALQSIADNLKLNLIATVNQSFALSKILSNKSDNQNHDHILIDIGEDLTNIVFVNNSKISDSKILNQGVSDLTNVLSKNLDVSLAKANQYKIDYSRDLFTEETTTEIDNLLSNNLEKYCQKIITKITKFAQEHSITNIYICGGGANTKNITPVLSDLLEQKLSGKIKINILTPDKINNVIDHTSTLRDTDFVPALALAKIGLQFSDFDSTINNFFKKIIQTLRN